MSSSVRLDQLPPSRPSRIVAVDWAGLGAREAQRLRELGFDDGVAVEMLHRGSFRGPVACRVGRMIIALRRSQAAAVEVEAA